MESLPADSRPAVSFRASSESFPCQALLDGSVHFWPRYVDASSDPDGKQSATTQPAVKSGAGNITAGPGAKNAPRVAGCEHRNIPKRLPRLQRRPATARAYGHGFPLVIDLRLSFTLLRPENPLESSPSGAGRGCAKAHLRNRGHRICHGREEAEKAAAN
jgi:hypothetical protein